MVRRSNANQQKRSGQVVAKTPQVDLSKELGQLLRSPERVKALVLHLERTICAKEVSDELGITLSMASHHVNELKKMKLIEHIRDEPRRGAVAHFHRAVMRPIWSDADWEQLTVEERQHYVTWLLQMANCDVAMAILGGTFQSEVQTHASRTCLQLDEQARGELAEIQDQALRATLEVEERCAKRMSGQSECCVKPVVAVMYCVDMPLPTH